VATIVAITAVPLLMATAMGVDYGLAVDAQAKLNSYADSAALAAVTPPMMTQTVAAAQTAAQNTFSSQASTVNLVTYVPSNLNVTITTSGGKRTATVAYTAAYTMVFPNILGMTTINLKGSSSATAGMSPNINFYLLMDTSPSMAIPATQAGINAMMAATPTQNSGGCAFACHQTNPGADSLHNPNGEDNYALARSLSIVLRIDLLKSAAQNLILTAQNKEAQNQATYNMGFYSFDVNFNTLQSLTSIPSSSSSTPVSSPAYTAASNVTMLPVYKNNWLTSTNNNGDADTNYDAGMSGINGVMPNPGSGTTTPGDTPQEVLFFVTDGVEDEATSGGGRQQSLMDNGWCTTIKNRGIRIAVLYTEYLPIPNDNWYMGYGYSETYPVNTFQSSIASQLQNCASSGLFYEVQTGGDISAALTSLFQLSVQSAYLSN
jgi:Flp pilus assembly protein TadG